jgi:hypothetical protein
LEDNDWKKQPFFFFHTISEPLDKVSFYSILRPVNDKVLQWFIAMKDGDRSGMIEFGLGDMVTFSLDSTKDEISDEITHAQTKLCCDLRPTNAQFVRLIDSKVNTWLKFLIEVNSDDSPFSVNDKILARIHPLIEGTVPPLIVKAVRPSAPRDRGVQLLTLKSEEMRKYSSFQVELKRRFCRHSLKWMP